MELVHDKTDKWDIIEGPEVDPTTENLAYDHGYFKSNGGKTYMLIKSLETTG